MFLCMFVWYLRSLNLFGVSLERDWVRKKERGGEREDKNCFQSTNRKTITALKKNLLCLL